jgi:hypothetical protein
LDAYWRACNYLAAGMIYLQANPLLREPLMPEHVKLRLLGHWGSSPGLSFAYVHLNRLITKHDLDAIFLAGPGHGAPGVLAPIYLEGTYAEIYPNKGEDEEGMRAFFKEFSFPGGIGSHCTPETPGSIHEGGELGYSVSHAFGAVFDNPDLLVAVMVGDGESETGALATSWHVNKSLNPIRDGAVLPILHLNGHKINNSTLLARISHDELECLFRGYGLDPAFCGRARSSGHAPADGRHPGGLCAGDPPSPAGGAYQRHAYPPALADDRPAQPQGLDRPQGRGWPQGGRVLACPSGAARWPARQPGPSAAARGLATQLQARGVVRRHRAVASGTEGARPQGARGA